MITSQLEIIKQGQDYLSSISAADYTAIISPNFISSAGEHVRHIIDHYLAIMVGIKSGTIDYDVRSRGGKVEQDPAQAMEMMKTIAAWIKQLSPNDLARTIPLSTEVSVSSKNVQTVITSVARELIFSGSHAVHHYAMIAQITFAQQSNAVKVPTAFGVAPATATFLREQAVQKQTALTATVSN